MTEWFTIYTRSDPPCEWCIKAKELLQVYGKDYYEKDISDPVFLKEFKERGWKKVPQVLRESTWIGGHDDLQRYLRKEVGIDDGIIPENFD